MNFFFLQYKKFQSISTFSPRSIPFSPLLPVSYTHLDVYKRQVVGVLGMEADAGTFQVLDICYPAAIPQKPLSLPTDKKNHGKIALVSGLNIKPTSPENSLRVQLLQEFLMGRLNSNISSDLSNIGKLIICGNSMDFNVKSDSPGSLTNSLEEFGKFLGNTLQSISIALMPGAGDPSDRSLPQQPLHKALFKEALRPYFDKMNNEILNLVTNPYQFNINGIELLAIAGQNINDIHKYVISSQDLDSNSEVEKTDLEHRLDLMECCLLYTSRCV